MDAFLLFVGLLPMFSQTPTKSTRWLDSKTLFPSDGRPLFQAEDRDLIQAVCPGREEKGGKVECGEYCPSATGEGRFQNKFDWSLERVTRGHFLSATSEDAIISALGCEPHSENFGGTILLTRRSERWRMLWYKAGVETSECHKVPLRSGREILVCIGQDGAQGDVSTELYLEDLLHPEPSLMAGDGGFFGLSDNTLTCGYNFEDEAHPIPLIRASIDKVEFEEPILSVTFRFGESPTTPEKVRACLDEQNPTKHRKGSSFAPAVKTYRIEFTFTGRDYKPTPSSAALAKRLGLPLK
jgi:hypothetical protein